MKCDLHAWRLEAALAEMKRAGIVGFDALPPYARLLLAIGLSPRPLHYLPLWQVALLMFMTYGLGVTLFDLWLAPSTADEVTSFYSILAGTIIASGWFSLGMTTWSYGVRKASGLSRWEDLNETAH